MTPGEKNIVKCLVAVAWADGKVAAPESGVIEGLLCGFDASEDEEKELLDYAKHKRTLSADTFESLIDMTGADFPGHDASWSLFSPRWRYRPRIVNRPSQLDIDRAKFTKSCGVVYR